MKLDVRAGDERFLDGPDGPGLRELTAALDLLPVASLVLAGDGYARIGA